MKRIFKMFGQGFRKHKGLYISMFALAIPIMWVATTIGICIFSALDSLEMSDMLSHASDISERIFRITLFAVLMSLFVIKVNMESAKQNPNQSIVKSFISYHSKSILVWLIIGTVLDLFFAVWLTMLGILLLILFIHALV